MMTKLYKTLSDLSVSSYNIKYKNESTISPTDNEDIVYTSKNDNPLSRFDAIFHSASQDIHVTEYCRCLSLDTKR